ncbi:MAG: hypothetical protein V9G18_01925 [Albidovulum sp.]|jgi:hypothetical protein
MTPGIVIDPPAAGAAAGLSGAAGAPQPALATVLRQGRAGPRRLCMTDHLFSTPAAFFTAGDRSTAARAWDAPGKGGACFASAASTGATLAAATGAALTTAPAGEQT